jgi:hypothetical protein
VGIPKQFNSIVQEHLRAHAAWLPITNTYRLGDYGLIADGVFQKIGNIKDDFSVTFEEGEGPDASLDFVSSDTTVVNTVAGAQVDVIPEGALGGKVTYKFSQAASFLVKAATIKVKTIENLNKLASQLGKRSDWEKKWRVVWETYHAEDAAILSTIAPGTEVGFTGDAKALKQLHLGNVSADLGLNVNKELGLKVLGKAGVVALGLFKLHWLTGGPVILGERAGVTAETQQNWSADLPDDV